MLVKTEYGNAVKVPKEIEKLLAQRGQLTASYNHDKLQVTVTHGSC